ncbi:MAG: secondary thiamine-phosphate synthase enzyme YjbQ [Thermosynechococcaceae cyanobacterium]
MSHRQQLLQVRTSGKCLSNITRQVQNAVTQSGVMTGLCALFLRHTSASLIIQENADPDVLQDLETFLAQLIPEGAHYRHSTEGPDDMPAHIRTALTHTSEQIPINGGRLVLGTWQGIYLWEHRQHGSLREVVIHVSGD